MGIAENLNRIKNKIGRDVTLIAVSKYSENSAIQEAYDAGQRHFGENKTRDLDEKYRVLPNDICWHFIGHLQRNKVKYIANYVYLIHSVDSWRLLREINKQAAKSDRLIPCLLQVYIANEDTKYGLDEVELNALLEKPELSQLDNVEIIGLMGMATNTEQSEIVVKEFESLKKLFETLKKSQLPPNVRMERLSMGMSQDFELAIAAGSNMVRIGSAVFKV